MSELFSAAHVVDAIIAFTFMEGMALWIYRTRTGRGVPTRDFAVNLLAGLCLMAALRSLVAGALSLTALCLMAAGLAHWCDLWLRWKR